MSKFLRKDDRIVVIAGNDKGNVGTVLSRSKERIIVQGINIRKKHMKRTQKTQTAQIVDLEMPIHISNVRFCNSNGEAVAVHSRITKDNKRELFYQENGKDVVLRKL
jgi:large subunit ribosomal protein L24